MLPYLLTQGQARLARDFARAQALVSTQASAKERREPGAPASDLQLDAGAAWYEARNLISQSLAKEIAALHNLVDLAGGPSVADAPYVVILTKQVTAYNAWIDATAYSRGAKPPGPTSPWAPDPDARRIRARVGEFGPLNYQNDNVLLARLGKDRYAKIKLLNADATPLLNVQNQSDLYAYEIVNFVNGKRSAGEIRDAVSAEFGPIPLGMVVDYLNACVEAKIVEWK